MRTGAGRIGCAATTNTNLKHSIRGTVRNYARLAVVTAVPVADRRFLASCAIVFVASVAITVYACEGMSGGMPMRSDWTMSMAWMRIPDRSWLAGTIMFMGMWIAMMTAMMSPVLVMTLLRFRRQQAKSTVPELNALTAAVAGGYLLVWSIFGMVLYPIGVVAAGVLMATPALARLAPAASAAILLVAGCVQLTEWKVRALCRCRSEGMSRSAKVDRVVEGWRVGLRAGIDCVVCCSGLMAVLIVTGVMNLLGMASVATAITAERLLRNPRLIARAIGVGIIMFALLHIDSVSQ